MTTECSPVSTPPRARALAWRFGPPAGLGVWFAVMLAVGATLMARHTVALPRPTVGVELAAAMASLRAPDDANRWMAVHVLYADCRCSRRIADHLASTPRPRDVTEHVLFVGRNADLEASLASRGFHVTTVEPERLAELYHLVAVPLLVVAAPDGTIRYAGGYTTNKQGPDPRDLEIIATAKENRPVVALPVFGCAVNEKLEKALNPLGLP